MTTAVRPAIRERIDPVLEAMITRELIGQGALPQTISGAQQQPGAPLTTLVPILIAALASQPQHVPAQQPSPLAMLFPVLLAILAMQQQPAQPSPLLSALSCALASAISGKSREREAGEGPPRRRSR